VKREMLVCFYSGTNLEII